MSAAVGRAPLVFSLALASLSRLAGRPPAGVPSTRQSGRIVTVTVGDGALLVDTERGSVLLLVAWDATIRGPHGPLGLGDLRIGDAVEWRDEGGQAVAMSDDLLVVAPGRQ
jgi:hypothetical protein